MNHSSLNNKLLVEECLKGNPVAQDKLFEVYYGFVYSICSRYAMHRESAEEMLNDTFYRCFSKLDKYDHSYAFEPWLRKLCVNCCLRHIEKYTSKIKFETDEVLTDTSLTMANEELPKVSDFNYISLLNKLPKACSLVANLYIIEGFKHHEIAEKLNISVGTSKSNLHRAKKLLYDIMKESHANPTKLKSNYGG